MTIRQKSLLFAAIAVGANVFGNLLLTAGMHQIGPTITVSPLAYLHVLRNPLVDLGVALLALWLFANPSLLGWADLSYVLPIDRRRLCSRRDSRMGHARRARFARPVGGHRANHRGCDPGGPHAAADHTLSHAEVDPGPGHRELQCHRRSAGRRRDEAAWRNSRLPAAQYRASDPGTGAQSVCDGRHRCHGRGISCAGFAALHRRPELSRFPRRRRAM